MNTPSLFEIVAGVLDVPVDQLSLDTGPKTLPKWDSLAHVTIAAAVEQTYAIQLTMSEILSIHSIANMRDVVRKHGVDVG